MRLRRDTTKRMKQEEPMATKNEEMDTQTRIMEEYRCKALAKNSRKASIRAMCVECMGGYIAEVTRCTAERCPLWRWRLGADELATPDPNRKLHGVAAMNAAKTTEQPQQETT